VKCLGLAAQQVDCPRHEVLQWWSYRRHIFCPRSRNYQLSHLWRTQVMTASARWYGLTVRLQVLQSHTMLTLEYAITAVLNVICRQIGSIGLPLSIWAGACRRSTICWVQQHDRPYELTVKLNAKVVSRCWKWNDSVQQRQWSHCDLIELLTHPQPDNLCLLTNPLNNQVSQIKQCKHKLHWFV